MLMAFVIPSFIDDTAEAETRYSNESLKGTYAFTNNFRSFAVTFGTLVFDGKGKITGGSATLNTLATFEPPVAMLVPLSIEGTYSVNPDGTGTAHFVARLPDGNSKPYDFDFVISSYTKVKKAGKVATELRAFGREREDQSASFAVVEAARINLNN